MLNEKLYQKILQIVFFISLFSPLIVDRRLFFPYVTTSALFFRMVVELLFVLWIIFVMLYPKYRPRFNLLISAIGVYLLALLASVIFGQVTYLSFWGDAERMMGFFGILHFFALFLVGTSIFRDKKDLKNLIKIFTISSLLVALYAILQRLGLTSIKPSEMRVVATVGNAGVLAAYMIFGFFFSIYLTLTEEIKWQKILCGVATAIFLLVIFLTGTRGAYLGVGIGFLFSVLFIIKNIGQKKVKNIVLSGLAAILIIYLALFSLQSKSFVKDNVYLYRITHFSINDATLQMRFMAWEWGLKGFLDKPIIGYGLENYVEPFNKYFEARYYDISASIPYFDRAHNIIIELLSTTGAVGFVSYLLLLGAIFYCLLKKYKQENDNIYFGVFVGLLIAYFVQNLFIFDILPAMIGFMIFLVMVNNNYSAEKTFSDRSSVKTYFVVPVALVLVYGLFYSYQNFIITPYKALKDNVIGQVTMPSMYNKGGELLRRSVSYQTVLDLDLRSSTANTILNYYRNGGSSEQTEEDLIYAASLYEENLKIIPNDAYYNYKAAEILDYAFSVNLNEDLLPKFRGYIDKAISVSPNRARLYYLLVDNLFMSGQIEEAVTTAEYAVSLNDNFGESHWELAKAYYSAQQFDKAKQEFIKTVDLGYKLSDSSFERFVTLFEILENTDNQIQFYELVVKNGTDNYLFYSTLATLYYQKGEFEKAIDVARISAEMNPDTKSQVDIFIQTVEGKIRN